MYCPDSPCTMEQYVFCNLHVQLLEAFQRIDQPPPLRTHCGRRLVWTPVGRRGMCEGRLRSQGHISGRMGFQWRRHSRQV